MHSFRKVGVTVKPRVTIRIQAESGKPFSNVLLRPKIRASQATCTPPISVRVRKIRVGKIRVGKIRVRELWVSCNSSS